MHIIYDIKHFLQDLHIIYTLPHCSGYQSLKKKESLCGFSLPFCCQFSVGS